jgi:CheY-like chemotaxis protein
MGKGNGLGLSTVYGIIQQSGGSIQLDSEPGKGTRFRIYLPQVEAPIEEELPLEHAAVRRGEETILLVEDREEVREVTARTLRDLGYQVLEAEGASTALTFVRDAGRPIDLLLTDVAMPGMNGFELADLIRSHRSGVRTLFMSGFPDVGPTESYELTEAYAYLPKPFTPHALADHVRNLLDRPSGGA